MRKHNGMRPLDLVVLMKLTCADAKNIRIIDLSCQIKISPGEISESIHRSRIADLLHPEQLVVNRRRFFQFLQHGLRYVFPAEPCGLCTGMPTAFSAPPLKELQIRQDPYVWPLPKGPIRGQTIIPLHHQLPWVCQNDPIIYRFMAIMDAFRLGNTAENQILAKFLHAQFIKAQRA